MVEDIREHGPFAIGPVRYYIARPKDTACRDVRATLAKLLEATGGDLDAVAGCLASSAWKHGAALKLLKGIGEEATYDVLFQTTFDEKLAEGKLQKSDTRFLK